MIPANQTAAQLEERLVDVGAAFVSHAQASVARATPLLLPLSPADGPRFDSHKDWTINRGKATSSPNTRGSIRATVLACTGDRGRSNHARIRSCRVAAKRDRGSRADRGDEDKTEIRVDGRSSGPPTRDSYPFRESATCSNCAARKKACP